MLDDIALRIWRALLVTLMATVLSVGPSQSGTRTVASVENKPGRGSAPAKKVQFETDVLPILKANCVQCHGTETKIKEMNLSTFEGVMKGSESGPVVIAGRSGESRLYKMVSERLMPPAGKIRLSEEQVGTIRAWINAWNDHPRPFVWTKSADEILDSIARYCTRINESRH